MGKYCGAIGYGVNTEIRPGVWASDPVERTVYGDIFKDTSLNKKGEGLNDDISLNMKVSFIADPYALNNYSLIKYATHLGAKWKVKSIEVQFPRLVLTLGGGYNAQQA